MLCPACHHEFGWHVGVCPTCGIDLVERLESQEQAPTPDMALVPVFATGDAALISIAKSLLEAEAIDYLGRGEGIQDLFGWGRIASGFNVVVGPVEFLVRAEDAERARDLLKGLDGESEEPEPDLAG
jgi:Putative prokaryotic signal transducing protein